ncbi:hypothetical protein HDU76_001781 [Blyttiomyces sp. JEL0837]|nr:hypothetical protein HDU76_001781 [Blyttiomyces sp. JEL0837]
MGLKSDWSKLLALRALINQPDLRFKLNAVLQIVECLSGNAENDFEIKGRWFNEEPGSEGWKAVEGGYLMRISRWIFHTNRERLLKLQPVKEYKAIVKRSLKALKHMAEVTPQTEEHRFILVLAEIERLKLNVGNYLKTVSLYQRSARVARMNKFVAEAGLANELCAQYLQSMNFPREAFVGYLEEALKCYSEWGALVIVKQMLNSYDFLNGKSMLDISPPHSLAKAENIVHGKTIASSSVIHSEDSNRRRSSLSSVAFSMISRRASFSGASKGSTMALMAGEKTNTTGTRLDFASILKASHNISGQQTLESTLKATLESVLENSGASRAALFQCKAATMSLICEARVDQTSTNAASAKNSNAKAIFSSAHNTSGVINGPQKLLNYVRRTNQTVILNNATHSEFSDDPYISSNKMKSILCTPLAGYSGVDLELMIYMEHHTAGVFTADRVEVSKLLLQQAAFDIDKSQTAQAVARFVPTTLLELLGAASVKTAALGDSAERVMSVLFADVRDYTSLSESFTTRECFKFANDLFGTLVPELVANGLVVDKFIGDAIMALQTDSDIGKGAESAVKAGISMKMRLAAFNEMKAQKEGSTPIRIGIGVHTGEVMLGLLGSPDRINVTVMSNAVNTASRIEAITKRYGASMLITDNTYNLLPNPNTFCFRILDEVIVKGQSVPLRIYEVIDAEVDPETQAKKRKTRKLYEQGFENYRLGRIQAAQAFFQQVLDQDDCDLAAKLFMDRCGHYLKAGMPADWNHVCIMSEK